MAIEEKAKAYDEAIERAKEINNEHKAQSFDVMLKVFPELKENEDEKIRKEILKYIKTGTYHKDWIDWLENQVPSYLNHDDEIMIKQLTEYFTTGKELQNTNDTVVEWLTDVKRKLEKQIEKKSVDDIAKEVIKDKDAAISFLKSCGIMNKNGELADEYKIGQGEQNPAEEYNIIGIGSKKTRGKLGKMIKNLKPVNDVLKQKSSNKVEPKFNVGDWVIDEFGSIGKIDTIINNKYIVRGISGRLLQHAEHIEENNLHLWTIQDAKNGDVLATENFIFIFKNIDNDNGVHYYCQYEISKHEDDNQFDIALPQSLMGRVGNSISHYYPATKEQRDLLFQKMHEAGYEWDAEKKELKKIDEGEKIRKAISQCIEDMRGQFEKLYSVHHKDAIAWLEKQKAVDVLDEEEREFADNVDSYRKEVDAAYQKGYNEGVKATLEKQSEQKSANKTEPKFKVGDWVVYKENIYQIHNISLKKYYECLRIDGTVHTFDFECIDSKIHLWTIEDAKDGNVLYECNEKKPFIFKELKTKYIGDIASYCDIFNGVFNPNEDNWTTLDIVPATKEQRELLFQKMTDAGYTFDFVKRELKKIEKKPTWSEKDETALGDALWCCKQAASIAKDENDMGNIWYAENWLKSLKNRYVWKPSDEQIKALNLIIITGNISSVKQVQELTDLYKDLKKLVEE